MNPSKGIPALSGFFCMNIPTDRVPLSQAQDGGTHAKEETSVPMHEGIWHEPMSYLDDIEYHRMSDAFDISFEDRKDSKLAEKLSFLTDWAREHTGKEDRVDHILAIQDLKRMLGITHKGKELITKLYQWTRLDQQRKELEKRMEIVKNAES